MGLGGGGGSSNFVQRTLSLRSPVSGTDLGSENGALDAPALAARQRAARKMADGMRQTFATSTRGLEGAAGSGLAGPPQDELPFITSMTDRELPDGVKTADQLMEEARRQREINAAKREFQRTGDPGVLATAAPRYVQKVEDERDLADAKRRGDFISRREFY